MIVDHQSHWFSPAYFEALLGRSGLPRASRDSEGRFVFELDGDYRRAMEGPYVDLNRQIADMDDHGVEVAVISPNVTAEVSRLHPDEALEAVQLLNNESARAQRDYPGRIAGLAVLPMQDVEKSVGEAQRAVRDLGLRGICVLSNIAGKPIGTPDKLPVYQAIEALGVPLFLHPAVRSIAWPFEIDIRTEIAMGWMFDTAAAALSLIFGGILDSCPGLRVIHPHVGGTLPYVVGRLTGVTTRRELAPRSGGDLALPLTQYLRDRFYVDCATATPGALRLAMDVYGPDRVLFASDFPWAPRADALRLVGSLGGREADAILANQVPELRLDELSQVSSPEGAAR